MRFNDKVVIVTGGGGGIGGAVSRQFAEEGAKVVISDIRSNYSESVIEGIRKAGGTVTSKKVDVGSVDQIKKSVDEVVSEFKKIDILVNCAGIVRLNSFDTVTEELWDDQLDINAKGTFFYCKAAAQQMIKQGGGGKIVNISSQLGKKGEVLYTAYCASKAAVLGITKCLALELAPYRINVNAICPGDVWTEQSQYEVDYFSKQRGVSKEVIMKEWADGAPLKKILQPNEIADIVLFLASDVAQNMTGQGINVTAGKLMY